MGGIIMKKKIIGLFCIMGLLVGVSQTIGINSIEDRPNITSTTFDYLV